MSYAEQEVEQLSGAELELFQLEGEISCLETRFIDGYNTESVEEHLNSLLVFIDKVKPLLDELNTLRKQ